MQIDWSQIELPVPSEVMEHLFMCECINCFISNSNFESLLKEGNTKMEKVKEHIKFIIIHIRWDYHGKSYRKYNIIL